MNVNDFDFTPDFCWRDGGGDGEPFPPSTSIAFAMAFISFVSVLTRLVSGPWTSWWWDLPGIVAGPVGVAAGLYGLSKYGDDWKGENIAFAAICDVCMMVGVGFAVYVAFYLKEIG